MVVESDQDCHQMMSTSHVLFIIFVPLTICIDQTRRALVIVLPCYDALEIVGVIIIIIIIIDIRHATSLKCGRMYECCRTIIVKSDGNLFLVFTELSPTFA